MFKDLQLKNRSSGPIEILGVYGSSKLANILHAQSLAKRLIGSGVVVNSLHPGFIVTNLGGDEESWFQYVVAVARFLIAMDSWQGAQTQIWATTHPKLDTVSGQYLNWCSITNLDESLPFCSWDHPIKEALWKESVELTKVQDWNDWRELVATQQTE
eukprot:TRINITY_DN23648_c0_g4_i1.p1 TRINITY_DN23648_c0_g4~~TRINITY_DN23648_c0_g4_i1.p1  ORF type:complete len:180 (+),score=7.98 TRINITY_DN23648_c0_g4_i1:72-542(+)